MPELHEGSVQFLKRFWGRHMELSSTMIQTDWLDPTVDYGHGCGFWESFILETAPLEVMSEAGFGQKLWDPPKHPRLEWHDCPHHPLMNDQRIVDSFSYGTMERAEIETHASMATASGFPPIKNPMVGSTRTCRGQRVEVGDQAREDLKVQAPVHYLALPLEKGGIRDGKLFWIDPVKPIRAIYFPAWFEESPTYASYGVYVKLDLTQLDTNHKMTPDWMCPGSLEKPGVNHAWEISNQGLISYDHSIVIDVAKYISLALIPHNRRKAEPMTAVMYTSPSCIPSGGRWDIVNSFDSRPDTSQWGFLWNRFSVSMVEVLGHESGRRFREEHPRQTNYLTWGLKAISFAGSFIPLVGPVLSVGLDTASDILDNNNNNNEDDPVDAWKVLGIEKANWDAMDDETKDLAKKQVKRLWKFFKSLF